MRPISIVDFIDKVVKRNELGEPFALLPHEREFFRLAYEFLPIAETFIYSAVKKSGKTTLQAIWHIWWAFAHSNDEIKLVANDFEQSLGRVFKVMCGIIRHNAPLGGEAEIYANKIVFANGSVVEPIANDAPSEAGPNQGDTGWDELWGFTSERSLRLWEELTPVPNKPSVRFVSTYAGWEGESQLLWDLYKAAVDKHEHPDGQAERIHPDLPIYLNRESRILCYWDHEPRMPWQTKAYYDSQIRTLRRATYLRLHENRWTSAESQFITDLQWAAVEDRDLTPMLPNKTVPLVLGVDIGVKNDNAAVAAVCRDEQKIRIAFHRVWRPHVFNPVQLADVQEFIEQACRDYYVSKVCFDPAQAFSMMQALSRAGTPVVEFPQTSKNVTAMATELFNVIIGKNLRAYSDKILRQHILNAVAIETPSGLRLAKSTSSKKIDLAAALAIAVVNALQTAVIDLSHMALIGNRRLMTRDSWDEQDEGSSAIELLWDRGGFSGRKLWDG